MTRDTAKTPLHSIRRFNRWMFSAWWVVSVLFGGWKLIQHGSLSRAWMDAMAFALTGVVAFPILLWWLFAEKAPYGPASVGIFIVAEIGALVGAVTSGVWIVTFIDSSVAGPIGLILIPPIASVISGAVAFLLAFVVRYLRRRGT